MSEQEKKTKEVTYSSTISYLEKEFKFKVTQNTEMRNRFHITFEDGRTFIFTRPNFNDVYGLFSSRDRSGSNDKEILELLTSNQYLTCTSQDKKKAMDFENDEVHRREGFSLWQNLLFELAMFSEKKT